MQAQFFNTPNGFGFKFPEFVLPKQVIEVPFPRYVLLGLRTVLANFSGKTVDIRVWSGSGSPGGVLFVDYNWIKRTGFPLVRKVEAVHGLSFHTLLGDLSFPETGDYSSPADDEYQIHLVLLK
ncbi:hypothetical protein LNA22_004683 [Salmonella enterica subsp. enterica serovar Bovismorbificans]|nr:hypothetical protein [Salmonella enterica subsp. enterica serovar Bovismorbificans]EIM4514620.1 hypothetical protein [Salmonella enterica subsp. enterica serovar Bovismorbificans]